MKKVAIYFAVTISFLILLSGCNQAPMEISDTSSDTSAEMSKMASIQFTDDQLYAVALVGYDDLTELSFYQNSYLDSDDIPIHYFSKGDYYLIIPRYSDMSLKLYKNDIVTESSTLVFEESDCKPFLIQCNFSDIFSDATISLTYNNETVKFSPYISLKDGALLLGEKGLDITK